MVSVHGPYLQPVELQHRARPARTRRSRDLADEPAGRLPHFRRVHQRARTGAGRPSRAYRSDRPRHHVVLHERRIRGRRDGNKAGAPVLALLGEDRRIIVARQGAYHGMAAFGTSLAGIEPNRTGWGPLVEDVIHVDPDSVEAFAEALADHPGQIAAFIGEPVRGAAGVYPPADRVLGWDPVTVPRARCAADRRRGDHRFGRLGTPFGCHRFGIEPDLVCAAKGISSGYAALGVVLVGARAREPFWRPGEGVSQGYGAQKRALLPFVWVSGSR